MLSFLAWLILLALIVAAAPAMGLLLGLCLSAACLAIGDRCSLPWGAFSRPAAEPAAFAVEFPAADEVNPTAAPPADWKFPDFVNLPGRLLRERQCLFRVECIDTRTGLTRFYAVSAKHAGAAEMKAHLWGERTRSVRPLSDH
jgi:hypothetical protein